MNNITLTALEATATLYWADATGAPLLGSPLWMGAEVEKVVMRSTPASILIHATADSLPVRTVFYYREEVRFGRVWWLRGLRSPVEGGVAPALQDFTPSTGRLVLDLVWVDAGTGLWNRRTYFGVTVMTREVASRGFMESDDEMAFDAEQYAQSSGTGLVPAPSPVLPQIVRYVSGSLAVDLYSYDAGTANFAEVTPGLPAGLATLRYSPDHSGTFAVRFAGAGSDALGVDGSGTVTVSGLVEAVPSVAVWPRVDFLLGRTRIASVSAAGVLYAGNVAEATPGAGTFLIYGGGAAAMAIAAAGITAKALTEA